MPIEVFRGKGISDGVKTERNQLEKLFLEGTHLMDLDPMSEDTGGAHEGGGRALPPGRAHCLVGPPKLHRRTPCTHIYLRTLKLPEQKIDREFRRRKPL